MDKKRKLIAHLRSFLPTAALRSYRLPGCPQLKLLLLDNAYDDQQLTQQQAEMISDDPPYWIFCWASGHAMSAAILDGRIDVAHKRVVDFGAGSGAVAIAAAMAGAETVYACELDPVARHIIELNAELNGVTIQVVRDLEQVGGKVDLLLAADVLYERGNLVFLDQFLAVTQQVVVADSRLKNLDHSGYRLVNSVITTSIPDYKEAKANNQVKFYCSWPLS